MAPLPPRARRRPASPRPPPSGCRANRGSGARGWMRWRSRDAPVYRRLRRVRAPVMRLQLAELLQPAVLLRPAERLRWAARLLRASRSSPQRLRLRFSPDTGAAAAVCPSVPAASPCRAAREPADTRARDRLRAVRLLDSLRSRLPQRPVD